MKTFGSLVDLLDEILHDIAIGFENVLRRIGL